MFFQRIFLSFQLLVRSDYLIIVTFPSSLHFARALCSPYWCFAAFYLCSTFCLFLCFLSHLICLMSSVSFPSLHSCYIYSTTLHWINSDECSYRSSFYVTTSFSYFIECDTFPSDSFSLNLCNLLCMIRIFISRFLLYMTYFFLSIFFLFSSCSTSSLHIHFYFCVQFD